MDFPLPDDPDELPDTPAGRAMRAFAQEPDLRARLASALVPLWVERLRRRGDAPDQDRGVASAVGRENPLLAEWLDAVLDEPDGDGPPHPRGAEMAEGA